LPRERVSFRDKNLGLTASIEAAEDEEVLLIFETDNPELAGRVVFFVFGMRKLKPRAKAEDERWKPLMAWYVRMGGARPPGFLRELREAVLMISFSAVDSEILSLGRRGACGFPWRGGSLIRGARVARTGNPAGWESLACRLGHPSRAPTAGERSPLSRHAPSLSPNQQDGDPLRHLGAMTQALEGLRAFPQKGGMSPALAPREREGGGSRAEAVWALLPALRDFDVGRARLP
jgi:hypothetical protein